MPDLAPVIVCMPTNQPTLPGVVCPPSGHGWTLAIPLAGETQVIQCVVKKGPRRQTGNILRSAGDELGLYGRDVRHGEGHLLGDLHVRRQFGQMLGNRGAQGGGRVMTVRDARRRQGFMVRSENEREKQRRAHGMVVVGPGIDGAEG